MHIVPSQVVQAIETLIGAKPNDLDERRLAHRYLPEVKSVLWLLEDVPTELIDLSFPDYLELTRCRAVLAATVTRWELGDTIVVRDVGGKDAVERIRRLMQLCHDALPPPEPELPFIDDLNRRGTIQDKIRAAWTNFHAQEWLGATTFAGSALESMLLWVLDTSGTKPRKKAFNEVHLPELIDAAAAAKLISAEAAQLAHMAKDARNLIHPGREERLGVSCNKASSLKAIAALYTLAEELSPTRARGPERRR